MFGDCQRDKALATLLNAMNTGLMLRAAVTTLLIPGTVIFLIPCFILRQLGLPSTFKISVTAVPALVVALTGMTVLLHCIREFALRGKGTLAPIDPPRLLVVHGIYRYTRNPMYLAVIVVLLSEALLFESFSLLLYAALVLLAFHLFVVFYEEPRLRSQFGKSYEEYIKAVPRWRVRVRPFRASAAR